MSVRQERPNPHDLPAVPASPGVRSGRRRGQLPLPGIEEQEQSHRAALPRAIVLRGAIGRCVGELPVTVFRAGPAPTLPAPGFPVRKKPRTGNPSARFVEFAHKTWSHRAQITASPCKQPPGVAVIHAPAIRGNQGKAERKKPRSTFPRSPLTQPFNSI